MKNFFASVRTDAKRLNIEWQKESGDFWAYNNKGEPHVFWTGYFSTYPHFKEQVASFSDFVEGDLQLNALISGSDLQLEV